MRDDQRQGEAAGREKGKRRFVKPENPFEGLARWAIAEDDAGRTQDLREYARERSIEMGGE